VTEAEFLARKARGEFALDWQAHGLHYGIPRAQTQGPGTVIFNGSRAALPLAAQVFPGLRVIMVTAPDAVLAQRLAARGREDEADIRARLARAAFTLPPGMVAETVMNDGPLATGIARLLAALQPVSA
jgi:phosphonate metabolism protein PhnN/1,5-bisphosphokinase (PRPP-forming)